MIEVSELLALFALLQVAASFSTPGAKAGAMSLISGDWAARNVLDRRGGGRDPPPARDPGVWRKSSVRGSALRGPRARRRSLHPGVGALRRIL